MESPSWLKQMALLVDCLQNENKATDQAPKEFHYSCSRRRSSAGTTSTVFAGRVLAPRLLQRVWQVSEGHPKDPFGKCIELLHACDWHSNRIPPVVIMLGLVIRADWSMGFHGQAAR